MNSPACGVVQQFGPDFNRARLAISGLTDLPREVVVPSFLFVKPVNSPTRVQPAWRRSLGGVRPESCWRARC